MTVLSGAQGGAQRVEITTDPAVIDGLTGLTNARQKTCSDSGAKSRELTKGATDLCLSYQTEVRGNSPSL